MSQLVGVKYQSYAPLATKNYLFTTIYHFKNCLPTIEDIKLRLNYHKTGIVTEYKISIAISVNGNVFIPIV